MKHIHCAVALAIAFASTSSGQSPQGPAPVVSKNQDADELMAERKRVAAVSDTCRNPHEIALLSQCSAECETRDSATDDQNA